METTITCKRCKECGALIAPTSILCPECEKRLMRKPAEANPYVTVSRRSDGTYVFDESFVREFIRERAESMARASEGPRVSAGGAASTPNTNGTYGFVNIDATAYDWS